MKLHNECNFLYTYRPLPGPSACALGFRGPELGTSHHSGDSTAILRWLRVERRNIALAKWARRLFWLDFLTSPKREISTRIYERIQNTPPKTQTSYAYTYAYKNQSLHKLQRSSFFLRCFCLVWIFNSSSLYASKSSRMSCSTKGTNSSAIVSSFFKRSFKTSSSMSA
jgi:hypothetical protein